MRLLHCRNSATSPAIRATWLFLPALACLSNSCIPRAAVYEARASSANAAARSAIEHETSINTANIPLNTVSVAPLAVVSADTNYSSLGHGMAALLMIDLSRSKQLQMVERLQLDALIRELEFGRSGRVDTLTAPKVGRLVGARRIVVGTIVLNRTGALRIDSHVANAVTGSIGSAVTGSATLNQVLDAEQALAFRLIEALGVTLTPAERRLIEQRPTRSLVAFLAFSRGARAEALGDFAGAAAHYAEAVRADATFSAAEQRRALIQGELAPIPLTLTPLQRVAGFSIDFVNRPSPVVLGTAADAPFSSLQQLITFTITIRTP